MRYGLGRWQAKGRWAGLLGAGLAVAILGCHEKKQDLSIAGVAPEASALLADKGAAAIATVCTRQSYATAKVGLIAGETGLQEDVFEMRDPVSFTIVPYRLRATVRLEALLRQGAGAAGRPKDQTQCMQDFADHLKTLSDPLVEAARSQKAVDALAFHDAEKEAQQEIETQERMEKSSR
ncbi:hypothetical protein P8936_11925 [Edaphobacter paludis]|uniref:Lipoprotein n=1 Tax=Edaphobacter paludis TaxID=3035702 RepID=A0AAU7CVA2_9BACT